MLGKSRKDGDVKHSKDFDSRESAAPSSALIQDLNLTHDRLVERLRSDGFARYDLTELPFAPWLVHEVPAFLELAQKDLVPDADDETGQRTRRYGRFLYCPSLGMLRPVARDVDETGSIVTYYVQGADFQPEQGGKKRKFAALTERVTTSPVLRALIEADWRVARRADVLPESTVYLVGVHVQRLAPKSGGKAVVTPDTTHRDGELATFVHMAGVENILGGWNAVSTLDGVGRHPSELAPRQKLAQFTLKEPGSGFVVDDRRVGHFLEGVSRLNARRTAHRTTILIDFCPVKWIVSTDL